MRWTAPFLAVVNVAFRPFLWEADGAAGIVAALEIMTLWALAIWKWGEIKAFAVAHRTSRLFWFSLIFSGLYVLLTGLALGNIGLIARQRVHLFPFLFMLLAGRPVERKPQQLRTPLPRRGLRQPHAV